MDEKVEYFENIFTKNKKKKKKIINSKKFNVKWVLPLKDFEIEVNKENKVYDNF